MASIHAAVLANFGGQDRRTPSEAVHDFEATMKCLGKPLDVKINLDARHAFENPNNKTSYRPEDTADAQARKARFSQQNLGH